MPKTKNVTFNLPPELIEKFKIFVKNKYAPSVNAAVKEALEEYSKKIEKEMLRNEMLRASKDPIFLSDLNDNMKAFETLDNESIKENSEW